MSSFKRYWSLQFSVYVVDVRFFNFYRSHAIECTKTLEDKEARKWYFISKTFTLFTVCTFWRWGKAKKKIRIQDLHLWRVDFTPFLTPLSILFHLMGDNCRSFYNAKTKLHIYLTMSKRRIFLSLPLFWQVNFLSNLI